LRFRQERKRFFRRRTEALETCLCESRFARSRRVLCRWLGTGSVADPDTYPDTDPDPYFHPYADTDPYTYPDTDTDPYFHPDTDRDTDRDTHPDPCKCLTL
jgi:hypothetical protein